MDKDKHISWKLDSFYKSIKDPKIIEDLNEFKKESKALAKKWSNNDLYLTDPKALLKLMDQVNKFEEDYAYGGKPAYYIDLMHFLDSQNTEILGLYNLAQNYLIEASNDLHFITMKLSGLSEKQQNIFLKDKTLTKYHKYLRDIFKFSIHVLPEKEQNIVNELSDLSSGAWNRMLTGILSNEEALIEDAKGKEKKYNFEKIIDLFNSKDKVLRDNASKAFNKILGKYTKVAEAEFNATLGYKEKIDKIKGFSLPEEERLLSDDVESKIVDNLREVIKENIDIPRRYYKVKAKLLGLKKLGYHERGLEYEKGLKTYTLDTSINEISRVFESIDIEFKDIFNGFINTNKVDTESKKGKSGGAFCFHSNTKTPTYILMNYHNKLEDLLTLAHESGHGINNELIKKEQMGIYLSTPPSTAEIASTFFEDTVVNDLISKASKEEKLSILLKKLDMDIASTFRQIAFYNFELSVHKLYRAKHYISHEEIGSIFKKEMEDYMGEAVRQDKGSENWWIYVPHFRYYFYVYSYAFGILISKYMENRMKKDPKYTKSLKYFLSAGTSDDVKNIMKNIGVDIYSKEVWRDGIKEIRENIELLEKLANELH
ncbi:MAG: M3 family metallopeptidase [bacterium]